ncbi:protein-tyrosine phosphatase-like protein [Lactarius hatsudake]|nr:protein-tyrosine phosphatase-like protein [Lactarius hatsudake]
MLSINTPTWQTSLLTAARERSGRQWPSFDRGRTASEVLPRVYLTDLFTARDETQLSTLGITHVISVIEHAPTFPQTHPLRTLHIPLSDSSDQDILAHLPTTTSFIRDALAESPDSRVMVHCLMGISRSATVVCAYLVATARVTPHEALMAVREKRGIVSPNIGFLSQLDRYADQLLGGQGRPRRAKTGKNVAETMRKLREAQRGPKPGSSSSTSTLTISDVTSAPSG